MGLDLVGDMDQIGIDGQVVGVLVVTDRADALRFRLDGVHDANGVRYPEESGLPINAFQDSLDCLVGGDGVAELFAAHPCNGVAEQGVVPGDLEFHQVGMDGF